MYGKYVIIKDEYGSRVPVLISEATQHVEVRAMGKPVSAGFFIMGIKNGEIFINCYGESVSLGLKSHPSDQGIIERYFNFDK